MAYLIEEEADAAAHQEAIGQAPAAAATKEHQHSTSQYVELGADGYPKPPPRKEWLDPKQTGQGPSPRETRVNQARAQASAMARAGRLVRDRTRAIDGMTPGGGGSASGGTTPRLPPVPSHHDSVMG